MERNSPTVTGLVADNLTGILEIVRQGRYEISGGKISIVNQELATLEMLVRRLQEGTLEVIDPNMKVVADEEAGDGDADGT